MNSNGNIHTSMRDASADINDVALSFERISLEEDSFMKIINSLVFDEKNGCLKIQNDDVHVFQFPKNYIYIRDCYCEMFRDIWKMLSVRDSILNIVIEGQPGIGKTSFIFVFFYLLKYNLSNTMSKEELEKIELKTELHYLNECEKKISFQKIIKIEKLIKMRERMDNEIININNTIKSYTDEINIYYQRIPGRFKFIFNINIILPANEEYEIIHDDKRNVYELTIKHPEEKYTNTKSNIKKHYREKYSNNVEEIQNLIKTEKMGEFYYLMRLKEKVNGIILEDKILRGYINTKIILNNLNIVNTLTTSCEKKKEMIRNIDDEMNDLRKDSNIEQVVNDAIEKVKENIKNKKGNKNTNDNPAGDVEQRIKDRLNIDILKDFIKRIKGIYMVKGKKGGKAGENKKYKFEKIDGEYKMIKCNEELDEIIDSIIVVDTCECEFDKSNYVISISSPDTDNYRKYTENKKYTKLYFDTLSDDEVEEWFKSCVDFDYKADEFQEVRKRYGNIPRNIYYDYLYKENYKNRDYWKYYQQLIESVVGTTGYNDFVIDYMISENLESKPLSNIILKYDMKYEWNKYLKHAILTPKKYLRFISEDVERYIVYKFYPPKNNDEYQNILEYYASVDFDDDMRRMALKQIVAYELSREMIKIEGNDFDLIINTKKEIPIHRAKDGYHSVCYILNEENCFDLIIEGVFIKILYDNEVFDETLETMSKSFKEYGIRKDDKFTYAVINEGDIHINATQPSTVIKTKTIVAVNTNDDSSKTNTTTLVNIDSKEKRIVFKGRELYYMRDCYYKIFEYICPNNFNFRHQRNYLIFGHSKIGKSILADVIKERMHEIYNDSIRILHVYYLEGRCKYNTKYYSEDFSKPLIVIADEVCIGEDDYSNAKMIILLANPSTIKSKTYQSKRCPLVMYIPPFTKEEVEKVKELKDPKYDKYQDYNFFVDKKELVIKTERNEFNDEDYKMYLELIDKCYPKYGGVIGSYDHVEVIINSKMNKNDSNMEGMINEMIRGINKPSNAIIDYDNLFIYNTDENDITFSNRLIFQSDAIERMVYKLFYSIDNDKECIKMINMINTNVKGAFAGYLYEKIIVYLIKECGYFRDNILSRMCLLNDKISEDFKEFIEKRKYQSIKVENEAEFSNAIRRFKVCKKHNTIPITELSYDLSFPDIDMLYGPFGIQVTISSSHTFAPEIAEALYFLYKTFKNGYDINVLKEDFKKNVVDKKDFTFGFFFISPQTHVNFTIVTDRNITKYPSCFTEMIYKLSVNQCNNFQTEILANKNYTICVPYCELSDYIKHLNNMIIV